MRWMSKFNLPLDGVEYDALDDEDLIYNTKLLLLWMDVYNDEYSNGKAIHVLS